jgi:hypothetical protein
MAPATQVWAMLSNNYAAKHNARYYNSSSNLVDLIQRLDDAVAMSSAQVRRNWPSKLAKALKIFKKNHPGIKCINDPKFRLCKSFLGRLKDILIDTTMQREPNLQWILNIIENFRAYQAQPIQVYATDTGYGAWDGMHTSLALYLITTQAMGMRFEDVEVPINVYNILSRAELRSNFIRNNTTKGKSAGKKSLETIDFFQQMIYGVEVDGATDPEWVAAHSKWKYLSAAGMFLTAEKFGNDKEIGAISRLNEINDSSVEVVRQFAVYGRYIVENQQRPINSKEIPIIIDFLNLCEQQDISYSDAQIEDLAQHCIDQFDANFDAKSDFWEVAHKATMNAYNKTNRGIPKHLWPTAPRNNKTTPQGVAFFWHQLQKSWAPQQGKRFKFPKQPYSVYQPDVKDLF